MASHLSTGSLVRANSYNINRFCYKFNQVPKRSAHHISCSSPPSNVSIIDAMALVLWYTSCAHIRFYIWELTVWDFQPLVNLKRMWSTQLQAFNCRYEHILLKFRAPRLIYDLYVQFHTIFQWILHAATPHRHMLTYFEYIETVPETLRIRIWPFGISSRQFLCAAKIADENIGDCVTYSCHNSEQ